MPLEAPVMRMRRPRRSRTMRNLLPTLPFLLGPRNFSKVNKFAGLRCKVSGTKIKRVGKSARLCSASRLCPPTSPIRFVILYGKCGPQGKSLGEESVRVGWFVACANASQYGSSCYKGFDGENKGRVG